MSFLVFFVPLLLRQKLSTMSNTKKDESNDIESGKTTRLVDSLHQSRLLCRYLLAKPNANTDFCNEFIDLLGGSVSLDPVSSYNQVSFSIPHLNSNALESREEEKKLRKNYDWRGKTVLIAEDEETNFLFLRAVLSKTGLRILHARTGKEAVEMVASNEEIHLILMDIKMPVMNGLDATIAIKTMNKLMKVIAQTAYVMEEERMNYYKAGCIDFLAKPIQQEVLLDTISKYL